VKRHQLRRALRALRANGEIAPAEAKRKGLVGHDGESLVRATNFQLFGFDMILCRRSRWAVTSSMAACTRVSMPCASVR